MLDIQQYSLNLQRQKQQQDASSQKLMNAKTETFNLSYSHDEIERMKLCGFLFDRRSSIKKEYIDEFFRKEPCLYDQSTYKYAARIFHCLKVDLNENPILKSLRQEQQKNENGASEKNKVAEVPRINYKNNQEKKNTLKLAFSVLRFQGLLEQLFDECQFYAKYPDSKDEQSLACTILFDYMMRKFQLRDLTDVELGERDKIVSILESNIYQEKTHLAAALARSRIKSDALSVEELLPIELREVEQHKAELPLYCWINTIKADPDAIIQHFISEEGLQLVTVRDSLDHKCFLLDPHCPNLLTFHYTLKNRITNHEFVKDYKLIIQDKSSCLAPHTVHKLLYKNDDVILTDVGGGLVAAYLGCIMKELDGRVFAFGATSDEKYDEISQKLKLIGCSKYVKLMREKFGEEKLPDNVEAKLQNVKVILINAPCSKSALMNPMEFLFQEGEDLRLLRDFSVDFKNEKRIIRAIDSERRLINYSLTFPYVRAIVYQTYSKQKEENEELIQKSLVQYNSSKKSNAFPYKLSPPVIPITMTDLQSDEIAKGVKHLQFKPSNKMNGCFVALLTRDKDAKVDKDFKKEYALKTKKAREAALAAAAAEEAAEQQSLSPHDTSNDDDSYNKKKSSKKSLQKKKSVVVRKQSVTTAVNKKISIDEQIMQLKTRETEKATQPPIAKIAMTYTASVTSLESRLAQIGKLKQEQAPPPEIDDDDDDEKYEVPYSNQPIHMKQYEFQVKKFFSPAQPTKSISTTTSTSRSINTTPVNSISNSLDLMSSISKTSQEERFRDVLSTDVKNETRPLTTEKQKINVVIDSMIPSMPKSINLNENHTEVEEVDENSTNLNNEDDIYIQAIKETNTNRIDVHRKTKNDFSDCNSYANQVFEVTEADAKQNNTTDRPFETIMANEEENESTGEEEGNSNDDMYIEEIKKSSTNGVHRKANYRNNFVNGENELKVENSKISNNATLIAHNNFHKLKPNISFVSDDELPSLKITTNDTLLSRRRLSNILEEIPNETPKTKSNQSSTTRLFNNNFTAHENPTIEEDNNNTKYDFIQTNKIKLKKSAMETLKMYTFEPQIDTNSSLDRSLSYEKPANPITLHRARSGALSERRFINRQRYPVTEVTLEFLQDDDEQKIKKKTPKATPHQMPIISPRKQHNLFNKTYPRKYRDRSELSFFLLSKKLL